MMAPTPEGLYLSEPKYGTFMERVDPKAAGAAELQSPL